MNLRIRIFVMGMILIILLNGCAFWGKKGELSIEDQASTNVAKTLEIVHGVETIVAMTLTAEDLSKPTVTEEPLTNTLTLTTIPTETMVPTLALTATFSVPMVSVSVPTNCRVGPGQAYDQVSVLLVGRQVEVVARSADGAYWVVRNPGGAGTCWLWGYYATVVGPVGSLPVWDPPPTPAAPATPTHTATNTPTVTSTPAPTTFSTGPLEIELTFTADLDRGLLVGDSSIKDLWYQAATASEKYLTPQNGAKFAIWGTYSPSVYQCLGASLSTAPIPLASVPEGTYVCYQTNEGRPGVFRVNGFIGTTIKIGYTTWNIP